MSGLKGVVALVFAALIGFILAGSVAAQDVPPPGRPKAEHAPSGGSEAWGASIPRAALKHRASLTRIAHEVWGLDAPVAAFAAQLHQESGWNPQAVSQVGAKGMAQFMPATARWWCEINGLDAVACQPSNPVWAMRALVGYDRWLFERVHGASEFDRLWAALRAYNGGLGHWQKEAAAALPKQDRANIDAACGKARRHVSFCPENLGYPRRILTLLQSRYLGWGRGVLIEGASS